MADILRVRSAPGEPWTEIPVIQGPQGEPGEDGQDGFSPYVTLAQSSNGWVVTITDKSGAHMFEVEDGAKGDKGDKGDPGDTYTITAADYEAIAQVVLEQLPSAEEVSY